MKDIEKELDKIENLIYAWAQHATDTWKRNPTAAAPLYGMGSIRRAIRNLTQKEKIEDKDTNFEPWINEGEALKKAQFDKEIKEAVNDALLKVKLREMSI